MPIVGSKDDPDLIAKMEPKLLDATARVYVGVPKPLYYLGILVHGAKGHSALQLSRDLDCQYKTAFVLAHKLREAMAAADKGAKVSGEVEIDGMYTGGYVKPSNYKADRIDRRLAENQTGKRRVVIVARERNGKTLPSSRPCRDVPAAALGRQKAGSANDVVRLGQLEVDWRGDGRGRQPALTSTPVLARTIG
jgi:hypothetical protein